MNMDTRSPAKLSAGIFGVLYALLGVVGFFVTGFSHQGRLGLLDLGVLDNLAHLAIGLFGVAAFAAGATLSRTFCQGVGVVLAVVAVLGIIWPSPLAVLPIGGANVILHAATALILLFVGFTSAPGHVDA